MNTEMSPESFDPRALATAWALGQLSAEERTAFEQKLESDSELAALAEETKEFCGLLASSLSHPTIELQEAARSRLLAEAEPPHGGAKVVRRKWVRSLTALAACVAAGGVFAYWIAPLKEARVRSGPGLASKPLSPTLVAAKNGQNSGAAPAGATERSRPAAEQTKESLLAKAQEYYDKGQYKEAEDQFNRILVSDQYDAAARSGLERTQREISDYSKSGRDETRLRMLNDVDSLWVNAVPGTKDGLDKTAAPANATKPTPELATTGPAGPVTGPESSKDLAQASLSGLQGAPGKSLGTFNGVRYGSGSAPLAEKSVGDAAAPADAAPLTAPVPQTLGGGQLFSSGATPSAAAAPPTGGTVRVDYGFPVSGMSGLASSPVQPPPGIDGELRSEEPSRQRYNYNPEADKSGPNAESYAQMQENPFRSVMKEPRSTFSTDVDTASYANVRRFLNMGQCPPPAAVRLEELVNYFPYDYAPPQDGKPFAVHVEMTSAPWDETHRLARIALKGKEIAQGERPPANLVFLVDVSGSMNEDNKLPLVKKSLKFVVDRLTEKDTVSLVTYAGESGVALPATNGRDRERIQAAIDRLNAGGSTNGAGGLVMAYAQAAQHFNKEGINRVILATDGDFNVGVTSHEDLLQLITEKAKSGTFLSVLGYGMGNTKDDKMELLADKGNGNYAYIDSLSEARKTLADQFNGTLVTIAKDVKVQIEFNPAIIRSYRLLGYENRMLAKEDFNDDKKDAGEIGAGHTVTALYELIPAGVPDQPVVLTDKLKYQPQPETIAAPPPVAVNASGETMTVNLRWKAPDADVSQLMEVPVKDPGAKIATASQETRWAVAVAGFASLLNNSRHAGLSWEAVRALAKGSKGADPNGYRGEFLQLVDKAASVRSR
jgi:secreted protein with Ig-like and vWFA domain